MNRSIGPLALAALCVSSAPIGRAFGAELSYKWETGKTYRFAAKSNETVEISGMGMGVKERFLMSSTFAIQIQRVKPDGKAEGKLFIESFSVTGEDGRKLAGLEGLPPSALTNLVEIDRKGAFRFKEEIFVVVDEESGRNLVVTGRGGAGHASATASDGEQEVTVWASFDPKTGALSGGATVKDLAKKKKQTKVKVTQDKPQVDLLPTQFMELLRLPDGPVAAGQAAVNVAHPNLASDVTMSARVLEETKELVRVESVMKSDTRANVPADGGGEGEDEEPGDTGMPGMEGMPGLGGMPGMKGGGADMSMEVDARAIIELDPARGMLNRVTGRIATKTSMGGMMSVKSDAELELVRR